MKVQITEEEWYPVLEIETEEPEFFMPYGVIVDVPDIVIDKYKTARSTFQAVQNELRQYYNKGGE